MRLRFDYRFTLLYAVIGFTWILVSDWLVAVLFTDPHWYILAQRYKGWFYVAATAVLFFTILRGFIKKERVLTDNIISKEKRYRQIIDTTREGVVIATAQGSILFANRRMAELTGLGEIELLETSIISLIEISDADNLCERMARPDAADRSMEARLIRKSGKARWVLLNWDAITQQDSDTACLFMITDIEELKNKESLMKKLIKEKETLLRELHHRVKNNLQIISSMLNLLEGSRQNPEEMLLGIQLRIEAIALVFDRSSHGIAKDSILFSKYLNDIISQYRYVHQPGPDRIKFETSFEDKYVPIAVALPCGIILIELLLNSHKHAFTDLSEGVINISFNTENDMCYLSYKDNGNGFDCFKEMENPKGLGYRIIPALIEQIKGRIVPGCEEGGHVMIEFSG